MDVTHAGGVVVRRRNGRPEFLLVTARRRSSEWVLPKGHIESGEQPEQTAVREVKEEAGVPAVVVRPLRDVVLNVDGEPQKIRYFLMSAVGDGGPREGRSSLWLSAPEALTRLSFPESRAVLMLALSELERPDERH